MYIRDQLKKRHKKGTEQNIEFAFWNKSLTELYQILTDLTRFHSEGDLLFHASALQCALPLFFCYSRTNHARWGSLCNKEFKKGSFVLNLKKVCDSAGPMNEASEKASNKQAKVKVA